MNPDTSTQRTSSLLAAPIFIAGIMPRSGTNFLRDLLLLHPGCEAGLAAEDYLLEHSDLLAKYAEATASHWKPNWKVQQGLDDSQSVLMRHIGTGLASFLSLKSPATCTSKERTRLVTKTPSVRNLSSFFTLFPEAQLIVLIRDGRSVVESGMRSFGWNFDARAHAWANAARTIVQFARRAPSGDRQYIIVRYEDVYQRTETEMKRILSFLGLDASSYDFEAASNSPVRGSSQSLRKGMSAPAWTPVERTSNFDPLTRWSYWSHAKRQRFNWIAGEYLAQFDYSRPAEVSVAVSWRLWNIMLEVKYGITVILARLQRLVRRDRVRAAETRMRRVTKSIVR